MLLIANDSVTQEPQETWMKLSGTGYYFTVMKFDKTCLGQFLLITEAEVNDLSYGQWLR